MKVSEYLPLYGLLTNHKYSTKIEGRKITVNTLFKKYQDLELSQEHKIQLDFFDLISLNRSLCDEYFDAKTTIPYLRELFDEYRQLGGDPKTWLYKTFETINMNPQNYKPEIRGLLESTLLEWIRTYEGQPFDALYENSNSGKLPNIKTTIPSQIGYLCKILDETAIRIKTESNVDMYCKRICKEFKLQFTTSIRNYYTKSFRTCYLNIKKETLLLLNESEQLILKKHLESQKLHG